ncbi:hypothetical protein [Candidatus Uabimicrobium sp. HlEnr_7]|uniref:hypothetical protein n=1 Tax=Candidatus Uabimicrobium helgolandensis TaxID=3095367 RepID=UPI0035587F88
MDKKELVQNINYIKYVISSSTEYTNLSGKANVLCGLVAIAGYFTTKFFAGDDVFRQQISYTHPFIVVWFCVFLFALSLNIFFIKRKAKNKDEPAWSRLVKMIFDAIFPAIVVGAFLTFYCIREQVPQWIPIVWMGMYGLGVWCASLFSVRAVRFLGAAFIITALLCLFFAQKYAMLILVVSFGGYHIIYGFWLYYKYGD